MVDDLLLNRAAAIERAIARVRELHGGADDAFVNQTRVEAITLSVLRACESSIGAAMHLVRVHRLGIPQETREAFDLIERAGIIEPALADSLRAVTVFRQAAVDHVSMSGDLVRTLIVDYLDDLQKFAEVMIRRAVPAEHKRG